MLTLNFHRTFNLSYLQMLNFVSVKIIVSGQLWSMVNHSQWSTIISFKSFVQLYTLYCVV